MNYSNYYFKNKLSNEQIEKIRNHYSIYRNMCDQGTRVDSYISSCALIQMKSNGIIKWKKVTFFNKYIFLLNFLRKSEYNTNTKRGKKNYEDTYSNYKTKQ